MLNLILVIIILVLSSAIVILILERKKLIKDGTNLSATLEVLNNYYEYNDSFVRDLLSLFFTYKETALDNIIQHKYAGEDAVIQHFLKSSLEFNKEVINKRNIYNKSVGEILGEDKEETN